MDVEEIVGGNIESVEMDGVIQAESCGTVADWGQDEMVAPIAKEGAQFEVSGPEFVTVTVHEDRDFQIYDELMVGAHVALHFEAAVLNYNVEEEWE